MIWENRLNRGLIHSVGQKEGEYDKRRTHFCHVVNCRGKGCKTATTQEGIPVLQTCQRMCATVHDNCIIRPMLTDESDGNYRRPL